MNWLVEKVSKKLQENKQLWVSDLIMYINGLVNHHPDYTITFPVSVSLDNCVGYFTPSNMEDDDMLIKQSSIVKFELEIYSMVDKRCYHIGETIFPKEYTEIKRCFKEIKEVLTDKKKVRKLIGEDMDEEQLPLTTDDIRLFIEGHLAEYNLVPLKNSVSFQTESGSEFEPNYFYLNYRKEYDLDDYLIPLPNLNFDILEGDQYNINITVTEQSADTEELKFIKESGNIYKVNDPIILRNLKSKSAKQLGSLVKNKKSFDFESLGDQILKVGLTKLSSRFGLKECISSEFLEEYPVYYTKDKTPVFHCKFTVKF
jgi:methionine aminopeptidase